MTDRPRPPPGDLHHPHSHPAYSVADTLLAAAELPAAAVTELGIMIGGVGGRVISAVGVAGHVTHRAAHHSLVAHHTRKHTPAASDPSHPRDKSGRFRRK